MLARALLVASLVVLVGLTAAPTATADDPCVVGASEPNCAVSVQHRVCVTEPCDELDLCLPYGRYCLA